MSFKIKRGSPPDGHNGGLQFRVSKPTKHPGAGGSSPGWSVPFRGEVIAAGYASDDTPIWAVYHPGSDTISGPYAADPLLANESRYSATHSGPPT
jgi:hypothetical protein